MSDTVTFVGRTFIFSSTISHAGRAMCFALPGLVFCTSGAVAMHIVEHSTTRYMLIGIGIIFGLLLVFGALLPDRWVVVDADARVVRRVWRLPWQQNAFERLVPFSEITSIGVDGISDNEQGDSYYAVVRLKGRGQLKLWEVRAQGESPSNLSRFVKMDPDLLRLAALTGLPREDNLK